jgi:3-dehydroquinate synthase
LAAALEISQNKAGLSAAEAQRVRDKLAAFGLPLALTPDLDTETLLAAARRDKKFAEGQIRYVLSPKLGEAFVADDVTQQDLRTAIDSLRT